MYLCARRLLRPLGSIIHECLTCLSLQVTEHVALAAGFVVVNVVLLYWSGSELCFAHVGVNFR